MALTSEQAELLKDVDATPSGDQSAEQAVNAAVEHFLGLCQLEGAGTPSEADVRAALK